MPVFRPIRVRTAFVFALAVLTAAAIFSFWNISRVEYASDLVTHSHDVLDRLDDLMFAFRDSISASRGLDPNADRLFRQAVDSMRAAIDEVEHLTADNPKQQQRIDPLRTLLDRIVGLEQRRLELAKTGVDEATALYRAEGGFEVDDQLRQAIMDMKFRERSLLSGRTETVRLRTRTAAVVLATGGLLGFTILLIVFYHLEREIRRRERSEARLFELNRLYAFLSQANQAIVHWRTREDLFLQVCRASVEHGQFVMAWIGVPDESGLLKPVASWGHDDGYLQNVRVYVPRRPGANTPEPGIVMLPEDGHQVFNYIKTDTESGPAWRAGALRRGYHSRASFPIKLDEQLVGFFIVFADRPAFFDDQTLNLLDEVAADLSFALRTMDQEEQRRLAESEVRRLNEELEGIIEQRTAQLADANSLLAKQNEELARASRLKTEFLARVSHEFRTPLNSIIGFSDLLAEEGEGPLGESYADYVQHVSDGAHHLLALVNDILDLSRIEAGRIDLRHEEFVAADAVSEVLSVSGPLAEAKNIQVESSTDSSLMAYGDRTRFKQILYNLLSNAVKFTPPGGHVQVSAELDYGQVRFCVRDDGIGIAPEQHSVIFEEFRQVSPATHGVKEGAGLGLAITRRLVELHGGRIWVESCSGCGSRFFFTIPAAQKAIYEARHQSSSQGSSGTKL